MITFLKSEALLVFFFLKRKSFLTFPSTKYWEFNMKIFVEGKLEIPVCSVFW